MINILTLPIALVAKSNKQKFKFVVRMLREELQLLQEQGSYVGEVVKPMDKKKVLVKVSNFLSFFVLLTFGNNNGRDHLKLQTMLDISSSSLYGREDDMFKRRIRKTIEIYCQVPTGTRGLSSLPST